MSFLKSFKFHLSVKLTQNAIKLIPRTYLQYVNSQLKPEIKVYQLEPTKDSGADSEHLFYHNENANIRVKSHVVLK